MQKKNMTENQKKKNNTPNQESDVLYGVGLLFSNLDGVHSGVEADKDTNNSENNSNVLDHSVSHISNESD